MPKETISSDPRDQRPRIPGFDADATPLIGIGMGLAGLVLGLRPRLAAWPLALTAAVAMLYRDPERVTPTDDQALFAPADGLVQSIDDMYEHRFLHTDALRMTIVSAPFDVPIQRCPAAGTISYWEYVEAEESSPIGSLYIGIQGAWTPMLLVISAGPIGRQVQSHVSIGAHVRAGQRLCTTRFGAEVALLLPRDLIDHLVPVGSHVRAGMSTMARHAEVSGFHF